MIPHLYIIAFILHYYEGKRFKLFSYESERNSDIKSFFNPGALAQIFHIPKLFLKRYTAPFNSQVKRDCHPYGKKNAIIRMPYQR